MVLECIIVIANINLSFHAGLTFFLNNIGNDGGADLICEYLNRFPECSHILSVLEWNREKRTYDVVRSNFKISFFL